MSEQVQDAAEAARESEAAESADAKASRGVGAAVVGGAVEAAAGVAVEAAAAARAVAKAAGKVDMIGLARETALKDAQVFSGAIKLVAPAKVNLHLAVGERRDDGYHSVTNIMHAVTLHDVLHMRLVPGGFAAVGAADAAAEVAEVVAGAVLATGEATSGVSLAAAGAVDPAASASSAVDPFSPSSLARVTCWGSAGVEAPDIPSEQNIVSAAVAQLARELQLEGEAGASIQPVEVRVEKFIPHQAGLGGGSSDAAAALLGAAHLWGVPADHPAIERAACKLGSDVAFFLHGGCARLGGTGEVFEGAIAPRRDNIVLIKPAEGLSTASVYRAFDEQPCFAAADFAEQAARAQEAADVPLFNNLAEPAERLMPLLADLRVWAQAQPGVSDVLLCGSGSTTFAICESFAAASALATEAKLKGWWARATTLSAARAAMVPRR